MQTNLLAATALAGSLLIAPLVLGSAQAGSAPDLKNAVTATNSGEITLVGHGGGGGGGGGGGFSGGGGGGGHVGGGGAAFSGGGGHSVGGMGGGGRYGGGRMGGGGGAYVSRGGGHAYTGSRSYATRDFNRGPSGDRYRQGGRYAQHDRGDRFEHRHFAERGHDFNHFDRHRVFRNGVWVWVYGPDYYAYGGDCYWLQRQAYATGSPYWWSRYNACVGYY